MKTLLRKVRRWFDYNPPGSLSMTGWHLFNKEFKERAPIRYFIKHTLKYNIVMPVIWKFEKIGSWVRYRTINRYHIVDTGLTPGYYDPDNLILHSSFNILKKFVEHELASHYCTWNERPATFFERYMPFYNSSRRFYGRENGLKRLDWEATLDDPNLPPHERSDYQAQTAREVRELYLWWVDVRPGRDCLRHPVSTDIFDEPDFMTAPAYPGFLADMDKNDALEEQWKDEDDAMLHRLINIRHSLWT